MAGQKTDTDRRIELCETVYQAIVGYLGKEHERVAYAYATNVLKVIDLKFSQKIALKE